MSKGARGGPAASATPHEPHPAEAGLPVAAGRIAAGCPRCHGTGYRGRLGLFELFEVDDELRDLILDQASTDELHEAARRSGMKTMREDGWTKVQQGIATFEEVGRETPRDTNLDSYEGSSASADQSAPQLESVPEINTQQPGVPNQGVPQQAPANAQQQGVPQQAPRQQPQQAPPPSDATADILSRIGKTQ